MNEQEKMILIALVTQEIKGKGMIDLDIEALPKRRDRTNALSGRCTQPHQKC